MRLQNRGTRAACENLDRRLQDISWRIRPAIVEERGVVAGSISCHPHLTGEERNHPALSEIRIRVCGLADAGGPCQTRNASGSRVQARSRNIDP